MILPQLPLATFFKTQAKLKFWDLLFPYRSTKQACFNLCINAEVPNKIVLPFCISAEAPNKRVLPFCRVSEE